MTHYKDHIDKALFERIESYLDQTMDTVERAAFEREMDADEMLRNEVVLQRRLIAAAEFFSHTDESVEKAGHLRSAPVKKMRYWIWYAAAAVFLAVIWFYTGNTNTPDKLFARYFIPDAGLPVVMSGVEDNYDFYNGMVSYKEGEYAKAIEIWKGLYDENAPNDTLRYFIGIACLNDNNPDAIAYLLPVAENENSRWKPKAIWYLALAYLKFDRKEDAVIWLRKIKDDEQATMLIKDIENLLP